MNRLKSSFLSIRFLGRLVKGDNQGHLRGNCQTYLFVSPSIGRLVFADVSWCGPNFHVCFVSALGVGHEFSVGVDANSARGVVFGGRWNGRFEFNRQSHGWKPAANKSASVCK